LPSDAELPEDNFTKIENDATKMKNLFGSGETEEPEQDQDPELADQAYTEYLGL
jgi:hypothetical protein